LSSISSSSWLPSHQRDHKSRAGVTTPSPWLPSERRDGESRKRSENVSQTGHRTIVSQITRPKATSPKLPSTTPAASSVAASLPRRAPGRSAFPCVPGHVFRSMVRLWKDRRKGEGDPASKIDSDAYVERPDRQGSNRPRSMIGCFKKPLDGGSTTSVTLPTEPH
jgi:hypothetical protein